MIHIFLLAAGKRDSYSSQYRESSGLVEATYHIDSKIICQHVARYGILLVTYNYLSGCVDMCRDNLLRCGYELYGYFSTRSVWWVHNGVYDVHVDRKFSVVYRRYEGMRATKLYYIINIDINMTRYEIYQQYISQNLQCNNNNFVVHFQSQFCISIN